MEKHFKYLNYVLRHKYYVFLECLRFGLVWRGIVHDWTKFLPSEWNAYAYFFYAENDFPGRQEAFDEAWNHHQKRNKHHWQYWVLRLDKPGERGWRYKALPMPHNDRKEMIADWYGAACAQGKARESVKDWYLENKKNILLHQTTRYQVERALGLDPNGFDGVPHSE